MKRKIIITGAAGFIGQYLVKAFLMQEDTVFSIVRNKSLFKVDLIENPRHFVIESDLADLTEKNFSPGKYDVCFYLGWHGVNRKEIDDFQIHKQNFENARKCLQLCTALGCQYFLDIGTRAEYGKVYGKYKETLECRPLNAYAMEKLRFYQYAYKYTISHGIQYIHFRVFSVIGKNDHPWSIISTACRNLQNNFSMNMGACEQLWNFMDVRDAVTAMLMSLENISRICPEDNRIINIANHDTRILRSFIEEIRIITKSKSQLIFDKNKKSEDVLPDISKLSQLTGFQSVYSFSDTVKSILEE